MRRSFLALVCGCAAADAGFAPGIERPALPPMGWRSWNWFACDIDQSIMEAQAVAMATTPTWATKSLRQLGFTHIGLDDCWQNCTGPHGSFHDPAAGGAPIVNTSRFPSLKAMAAKATVLGLSSGFYG
jgi:alpha-galactosidase